MLEDTKNTSNCSSRGHKREGDPDGFWWEKVSKSRLEEWTGRSGPGKEVRQNFPTEHAPGTRDLCIYSRHSQNGSSCLEEGEEVGLLGVCERKDGRDMQVERSAQAQSCPVLKEDCILNRLGVIVQFD